MGLMNFTIQESSPLIVYSGGWRQGTNLDSDESNYNGSFRTTSVDSSYAALTFVGTGITVFGSMQQNHGNYTVSLDGGSLFIASGFASPSVFNHSLWSVNGLDYGSHTVKITNKPTGINHSFLNIDYIDIERRLGEAQDPIFRTITDDSSPMVKYTGPDSPWVSLPIGTAVNGSLHRTASSGAEVTLKFQGCCIEIYGQYANANYTVLLDDQKPQRFAGLDVDLDDEDQYPGTLLYLIDGLSEDRNHSITLTNLDTDEQRPFYFDYAIVTSTHNIPPDTSGKSPSLSSQHKPSMGGVIGGVIGGLIFLNVLAILCFFYIKKWRGHTTFQRFLSRQKLEPYVIPRSDVTSAAQTSIREPTLDHSSASHSPEASSAIPLKVFHTAFQPLVFPGTENKDKQVMAKHPEWVERKPLPPRPPSLLR